MKTKLPLIFAAALACGLFFTLPLRAADAPDEPKTLMTERGKLIFSDELKEWPDKQWTAAKGAWEIAGGALKGAEKPEDKHGAVARHQVKFTDAVLQFSVRLDGAKTTSFSINTAKGHLCRVIVKPGGFTVMKDSADHGEPDKAITFQNVETPIKPGEWHTFVVEILGKEMLASLDGGKTGYGTHDVLSSEKANIGLTVSGQSASFKNVRVWEAIANKDWAANKAKLSAK
jgi:Domain of Unknown Function (DUF1080)